MKKASIFITLALTALVIPFVTQANVIKSSSGGGIFKRSCPSVVSDFNNYVSKWGSEIVNRMSGFGIVTTADITPEHACLFNTAYERFYDDGNPGSSSWSQVMVANEGYASLGNKGIDDIWLESILDASDLALPEQHFVVGSNSGERNGTDIVSIQSLIWTGENATLEFNSAFNFSLFKGPILDNDIDADARYTVEIGVSNNMAFNPSFYRPKYWGDDLLEATYHSMDDTLLASDGSKVERHLSLSFDVTTGQEFQLWGYTSGIAFNGGWIDSANTLTSSLKVTHIGGAAITDEESKALISQSLSKVSVPEPSIIALFGLGLLIFTRRSSR